MSKKSKVSFLVDIKVSTSDLEKFKSLKFDGDEVVLNDKQKDKLMTSLDRLCDAGVLGVVVKSWGYQEEGYLLTDAGKQILQQLGLNKTQSKVFIEQ